MPGRRGRAPRCWSGTPTTCSRSATHVSTQGRSRHGWPRGWRPGALPSTRTRPASSTSTTGWTPGVQRPPLPRQAADQPSKAAVKPIRARLTTEMRALRGHNAREVLIRMNPIIRGWSAYYRHFVSSKVFDALDDLMWKLTYKWATWTHPPQGETPGSPQLLRQVRPPRRDRWVFGDRDSGAYLLKFSWTKITRHTLVKGWASPDDPALTSYWAARRRRGRPPLDPPRLRLLQRQRGRCPLCGQLLLHADQEPHHPDDWEQWIKAVRTATRRQAIAVDARSGPHEGTTVFSLIHTHCRRRLPDGTGGGPALLADLTQFTPSGLPEPVAWKAGMAGSEGAAAQQCAAATRLEGPVLPAGGRGARVRAGRCQAGQEPARPAEAGPGRFAVAGGVLRARRGHLLFRGHPGVPDHPAAHPLPAGPDRGADPGEAARGEAAGISRDQDLLPC